MNKIIQGDSLQVLKEYPENYFDSIVTDPPYGLSFMGKKWDYDVPSIEIWKECLRVLKPGGYLLSFAGSRTYHRMCCNIEDSGFEIRDMIMWLYGSGFPKSLNIGKQIDKINGKTTEEFIALGKYLKEKRGNIPQNQISKFFPSKTGGLTGCVSNWELGMNVPTKEQWIILKRELNLDNKFDYLIDRIEAEREVIGKNPNQRPTSNKDLYSINGEKEFNVTAPATPEAKEWEGWGTALKPAHEPIVVARKPLSEKNNALNVLKWGTGGINIDGCRIGNDILGGGTMPDMRDVGKMSKEAMGIDKLSFGQNPRPAERKEYPKYQGRFPANIILDEEAGKMLDEQSGISKNSSQLMKLPKGHAFASDTFGNTTASNGETIRGHNDKGGASRFFYCAKASKSERNNGCEDMEEKRGGSMEANTTDVMQLGGASLKGNPKEIQSTKNNHPTVKPIKLMQYLVRLVTKKGGLVLDPFMGSGSTGIACVKEGFNFTGIELDEDYIKIAKARIETQTNEK